MLSLVCPPAGVAVALSGWGTAFGTGLHHALTEDNLPSAKCYVDDALFEIAVALVGIMHKRRHPDSVNASSLSQGQKSALEDKCYDLAWDVIRERKTPEAAYDALWEYAQRQSYE